MIVTIRSPLKKKEIDTSLMVDEEEVDEMDEAKEEETKTKLELPEKGLSNEELIFPKHFEKPSSSPPRKKKMFDTTGLDRIDESRSSPLKIFKYLNRPAENSLYDMETTFSLGEKFEFMYDHPLLQECYSRVINEEDYMDQLPKKVFDDTSELLNSEEVSFIDGFNILGMMFILKKLMDSFEINLSIENNLNVFGGVSQSSEPISNIMSPLLEEGNNPYYLNCPKVLTLYHLHLLCSNFNDHILILHFSEASFHSFHELRNDQTLRELVLKQVKTVTEEILEFHLKRQFFSNKLTVTISKLSKCQKDILFELHLPYLQKGYLLEAIDCLSDGLSSRYKQSFSHVTSHKLFRYCHMKADDLDLWGYKQFKDSLFIEEKFRGGLPYIPPKAGWFRFGMNVSNYYQTDCETDWFSSDNGSKEWAVCYCNLGLGGRLTTPEREIYRDLFDSEDAKGEIGFGILGTFDLAWLEDVSGSVKEGSLGVSSWTKDEVKLEFFGLEPFEIMDANFKSYKYLLALQCRVNPDKIRWPEKGGKRVFLVNDPRDVRPYGILIKKLDF